MADKYRFDDSINAKGKQNHVHYLNDKPLMGTSTVLSVLAKPLVWWAAGLAVGQLGWTPVNEKYWEDGKYKTRKRPIEPRIEAAGTKLAEIKEMLDDEYLALLDAGYKAHAVKLDDSADVGKNMHYELEMYIKRAIDDNHSEPFFDTENPHPAVVLFSEWAMANVNRFIASEAYCYSKRLWTGGIVDVVYEDRHGKYGLLDFKSAQEAYDSHFMQNAGYDIAISENGIFTKEGELIMEMEQRFSHYAVLPYGLPEPQVSRKENTLDYQEGFEACVTLYRLMNPKKF
jgi:hypothetical protein